MYHLKKLTEALVAANIAVWVVPLLIVPFAILRVIYKINYLYAVATSVLFVALFLGVFALFRKKSK